MENDALSLVVGLAVVAFFVAVMWKVFVKAGQPGWAAIIPFYNVWVMFTIVGLPGWFLFLCLIPIVGWIFQIWLVFSFAKVFGRGAGFGVGLVLLGFIFFPILAFGSDRYIEPVS